MPAESLVIVNTIIAAVNLALLISIAFYAGKWMGRVEVRIEQLEKKAGS